MDKLEYAKIHYPIGTVFISPQSGDTYTVMTNTHKVMGENVDVDGVPWLFFDGIWAQVISYPKNKIINQYEIY